jgi:hypothetical protein
LSNALRTLRRRKEREQGTAVKSAPALKYYNWLWNIFNVPRPKKKQEVQVDKVRNMGFTLPFDAGDYE